MATYAIGDIQGCFAALQRLLDHCRFNPTHDRLWFVGDLINRGPQSLETLRFVKNLGDAAITVLGNHDLYLLMVAAQAVPKRGRDDTLDEVLAAPDLDDLLDWLRRQPLCYREGPYCVVHAGLLPAWSADQARSLAREVEAELAGDNWQRFLQTLWGDEPAAWRDDLTGTARHRVIVNAMTRMRFCSPDGEMEFRAKGELSDAPSGFLPWFDVPGRRSRDGETVLVTGHWSALGLFLRSDLLALDSGCLWGGALTALRLEDRKVFQVDCGPGGCVAR